MSFDRFICLSYDANLFDDDYFRLTFTLPPFNESKCNQESYNVLGIRLISVCAEIFAPKATVQRSSCTCALNLPLNLFMFSKFKWSGKLEILKRLEPRARGQSD